MSTIAAAKPVLQVSQLSTSFTSAVRVVTVVHQLSLDLYAGRMIGIVGESGCGKSVTALSIMRLYSRALAQHTGRVLLEGEDLLQATPARLRQLRGNRIAMIFQDPANSFNPVMTIGRQIEETIVLHRKASRAEAREAAVELLDRVALPDARQAARSYPFQLSGGMRQRAMIAMALSCNPAVLIADEPTTALDTIVQAQVISLLSRLQKQLGLAGILITHNLNLAAQCCDRIAIMYAGRKVEEASAAEIFRSPRHPYTRALIECIPTLRKGERLKAIGGSVPSHSDEIRGCAFAPRCGLAHARCWSDRPRLEQDATRDGHVVACFAAR